MNQSEVYSLIFQWLDVRRLEATQGFLPFQSITNSKKFSYCPHRRTIGRLQIKHLSIYIAGAFVLKPEQNGYIRTIGWCDCYFIYGSRSRVNLLIGQEIGDCKKANQDYSNGSNAIANKHGGDLSYDTTNLLTTKLKTTLFFLTLSLVCFCFLPYQLPSSN